MGEMTPIEDVMTLEPGLATVHEARDAMGRLQAEVKRLRQLAFIQGGVFSADPPADLQRIIDARNGFKQEGFGIILGQDETDLVIATVARFQEREPLVRALLDCFDLDAKHPSMAEDCGDGYRAGTAALAVRDFKLDGLAP